MLEAMEIDKFCAQITDYFTEHYLEKEEVTVDELSDEIRRRLMLIDDSELRSQLVRKVLDDLREVSLIYKYRDVYRSPSLAQETSKMHANTLSRLTYNFQRLI